MIRKAYIRHREALPENVNNYTAWHGFQQLGVETAPFYGFGDVETLEDIGPEVAVLGFVGDALAALKKIGAPEPKPIDYPEALESFRGRRIWQSTLDAVAVGTFVKPMRHKLFTGRVWTGSVADRIATEGALGVEPNEPVWCSEVVEFVAEFRAFVLEDRLLDVRRYRGAWWMGPAKEVVERAVMAHSDAPAAYAL